MSKMRKVLIYIPRWEPSIGGMEIHVDNLVRNSSNFIYEIMTAAAPDYPEKVRLAANAMVNRIGPADRGLVPFKNKKVSQLSFPYRYQADIQRASNFQSRINLGDYDLLHLHYPYIPHTFVKLSRMRKGPIGKDRLFFPSPKPRLLTVHGMLSLMSDDDNIAKYEKEIIDSHENIICVDIKLRDWVLQNLDKESRFIPNSIDTRKFSPSPFKGGNKLKVGFVGRLEKSRGVHLLEALIKHKPDFVDLYIIGGGNTLMVSKFRERAKAGTFRFKRNVPNEKLPGFLRNIDVLFNPVMVEGASRISLEAMACGRPPIMIDKGDRRPVVDGETGYLAKNNIDSVLKVLNKIYESDDVIEKIGANARSVVEKEFSNEAVIPKIEQVYREVMAGR